MNLTLKLDPTNWLEATWFEQTSAPDTVIPAKAAVLDEEGNEVSPAESERIEPGRVTKTQIKCVSYHPTQIDMLRADAVELGTDLTEHEALLADWVASYVSPDPEPVQVPQVVTIRQAKLALLQAGLLDDVDAAVAQADRATQIEWEYATEVRRGWPTLLTLQTALGLTEQQVNDLFISASLI